MILSPSEIDDDLKQMKIFNMIIASLNRHLKHEDKLELLQDGELDNYGKVMDICNRIFDGIGTLIKFDERIESVDEINSNEKLRIVLNRMISVINGLGKLNLVHLDKGGILIELI